MIRVTRTSELSQQRNDAITYFTCSLISWYWELFFHHRSRELYPPIAASMFVKAKSVKALSRYFGIKFLQLEIRLETGQSYCSAIILNAFDIQFHFIVVPIFLKTSIKDDGDGSTRLLERIKDLISMHLGALVRGFVNILVLIL